MRKNIDREEPGAFLCCLKNTSDINYKRYLSQRYDTLISLIKIDENDKILDAGCGDGAIISLIINKKIRGVRITALDNSRKTLNSTVNNFYKYRNVEFVKADIQNLPFPKNYFDKTICCHVIEHINEQNLLLVLRELKKVTQKELILSFPNKYSLLRIWEILSQEGIDGLLCKLKCFLNRDQPLIIDNPKHSNARHVFYSTNYVKKNLEQIGFKPKIVKQVYLPIACIDISQKGYSVPFGHSVIIKSIKIKNDE